VYHSRSEASKQNVLKDGMNQRHAKAGFPPNISDLKQWRCRKTSQSPGSRNWKTATECWGAGGAAAWHRDQGGPPAILNEEDCTLAGENSV